MAKLENVLSVFLTIAGVAVASAYVYRQFVPMKGSRARDPNDAVTFLPNWREIAAEGVLVGPADAMVKIIEFSDVECPFCKKSHETIRKLMNTHVDGVAYYFIHFPLPNHRFATPGARAAECARQQGKFIEIIDRIFAKQDSLGLKTWVAFAEEAGVSNIAQFEDCVSSNAEFPSIRNGLALGRQMKIRGTPTVVINGWRYERGPSPFEIEEAVRQILSGKAFRRRQ